MSAQLNLIDNGMPIDFTVDDIMKYHGPGFPGGVAHAVKVLERALPALSPDSPAERREITISTAHRGQGVRDTFEAVARAVTEERFTVESTLERSDRGSTLERYVFVLTYRGTTERPPLRCDPPCGRG